jgi:hypothetical protein
MVSTSTEAGTRWTCDNALKVRAIEEMEIAGDGVPLLTLEGRADEVTDGPLAPSRQPLRLAQERLALLEVVKHALGVGVI